MEVRLRGHFQPIDGLLPLVGPDRAADAALEPHSLRLDGHAETPHGEAAGRLSDVDPWGRFRVSGTGRPPSERDPTRLGFA